MSSRPLLLVPSTAAAAVTASAALLSASRQLLPPPMRTRAHSSGTATDIEEEQTEKQRRHTRSDESTRSSMAPPAASRRTSPPPLLSTLSDKKQRDESDHSTHTEASAAMRQRHLLAGSDVSSAALPLPEVEPHRRLASPPIVHVRVIRHRPVERLPIPFGIRAVLLVQLCSMLLFAIAAWMALRPLHSSLTRSIRLIDDALTRPPLQMQMMRQLAQQASMAKRVMCPESWTPAPVSSHSGSQPRQPRSVKQPQPQQQAAQPAGWFVAAAFFPFDENDSAFAPVTETDFDAMSAEQIERQWIVTYRDELIGAGRSTLRNLTQSIIREHPALHVIAHFDLLPGFA